MLQVLKRYRFSTMNPLMMKKPDPVCMVIHPVLYPNKGATVEHYLAEQAIGLASSLRWKIVEGPFWNSQKPNHHQLFKDLPRNTVYIEPEYGDEIRDGTYVKSSMGKGIYYKDGIIFDEMQSESDGDLHSEWKNKIVRDNLATSSLLKCKKVTQKYFFTKGKIEKIVSHIINSKTKIDCLFINNELKPGQIRNLKKVIEARLNSKKMPKGYGLDDNPDNSETQLETSEDSDDKKSLREKPSYKKIQIFDRFSIILQIFAQRTTSKLAKMQIELSYLAYLRTRLVRDGSTYSSNLNLFSGNLLDENQINLEIISARQRRAMGIMSGEGESQLEIERRNIRDKEAAIRRQIEDERKLRNNRKNKDKKRNSEVPVIALVGYTNVGKSAFMNYVLGKEEVSSKDLLFQTLKTTSRYFTLPSGTQVSLLDTIGFITDLPLEMIDSFKMTLEDISHADIVIHLRDISHPQHELQRESVVSVLKELMEFQEEFYAEKMIQVWNKVDLLTDKSLIESESQQNNPEDAEKDDSFKISCTTGQNMKKLLAHIDMKLKKIRKLQQKSFQYPYSKHHKVIQWLKSNANVSYNLNEEHDYDNGTVKITLQINDSIEGKFMKFLDVLEGREREKKMRKRDKGMPPKQGW